MQSLFVGALELTLLCAALAFALHLVYGARGAVAGDRVYFVLRLAVRVMLFLAVCSWAILITGGGSLVLLVIAIIVGAGVWGEIAAQRRRTLLWMLATCTASGLPLPAAVRALAEEQLGRSRRKTAALAAQIESGAPLSDAMRRASAVLPLRAASYARVGIEVGDLSGALHQAVADDQQHLKSWRVFSSQLLYLIVVGLIGINVMTFCVFKIIPAYEKIFYDFEMDMPAITQTLMALTYHELVAVIWAWFGILLAGSFFYCLALQTGWMRESRWLARWLPGRNRSAVLNLLAIAAERGRPLLHVLRPLSQYYPLPQIARRLGHAADEVEQGGEWRASLQHYKLIGATEAAVLAAAERNGNLPWALHEMGDHAARRDIYRVQAALEIAFPLAILLFSMLAAFFAISLFIPIVKLISSLT